MNYSNLKNQWTSNSTLHSSCFDPFIGLERKENYTFKDLGNPRLDKYKFKEFNVQTENYSFKEIGNPRFDNLKMEQYSFKDLGNPRLNIVENYYSNLGNIYTTKGNVTPSNSVNPKKQIISKVKDGLIETPIEFTKYSPACSW